ncbi:hypothetical protein J6590_065475 [Homalodisca vitripennis]|nr:hypothetical protein J6590_065475 [Homalodisca vitripennis]
MLCQIAVNVMPPQFAGLEVIKVEGGAGRSDVRHSVCDRPVIPHHKKSIAFFPGGTSWEVLQAVTVECETVYSSFDDNLEHFSQQARTLGIDIEIDIGLDGLESTSITYKCVHDPPPLFPPLVGPVSSNCN